MLSRTAARPLLALPVLAVLALGLTACGDDDSDTTASDDTSSSSAAPSSTATSSATSSQGECEYVAGGQPAVPDITPPPADPTVDGDVDVTMETSIGTFHATLDAKKTPCTVNSFVSLVEQGYFDGTSCHRMTVSKGFQVLQCGDPTGSGSGGPGYSFDDELSGSETYSAGTLAMANAGPNTNGSQFFFVWGDTALSPDYTVFGKVDQATIDAITDAAKAGVTPQMGPEDGAPKTPIDIESASVG